MIEAGETGGILDTILQRLVDVRRKGREVEVGGEVGLDLPGIGYLHRGA